MVGVRRCEGFTLAELLVATAVTLVALGLAAILLHPVSVAFQALPDAVDSQQRLRIAAQTIADDIMAAGAGPVLGWAARAVPAWPAVIPCRWAGEPLGTRSGGCVQEDEITLAGMSLTAPQAVVADNLTTPGGAVRVAPLSACTLSQAACRFHEGARALVSDGTGAWDVVRITAVSTDGLTIEHAASPLSRLYRAGALIGEIGMSAYSVRLDPATGALQLRRSTDGSADAPVLDYVSALSLEYFGLSEPPAVLDDADPDRRRTSYGPLPPPAGVDDPLDSWPAGENCLFSRTNSALSARQIPLSVAEGGLARLPLPLLADGPWCPDAASPNRYDADLLRIRLVRITLRVRAQSPAVRGLDARLFSQPGGAREAARLVPDLEVRVDAALRNR